MKKQKQKVIYNEHDYNQVQTMRRKIRNKKKKRRRRALALLIIIVAFVAFLMSDYSKIKSIDVTGNERVSTDYILKNISVQKKKTFIFSMSCRQTEKEIEKLDFVKKANVKKSLLGHVDIDIVESQPLTYAKMNNVLYIVDETGKVIKDENQSWLSYVQRCPEALEFDEDTLVRFAKNYKKISSIVRNRISAITLLKESNDPDKCQLELDDGKIFYVRIDQMEKQLTSNNYYLVIKKYPDAKHYDFLGRNVYVNQ